MVVTRTTGDLKQLTDTSDGIYIKFMDDVELIIPIELTVSQKATIMTAARINASNMTIDLNDLANPVKLDMT
jgi:hypothetical protein